MTPRSLRYGAWLAALSVAAAFFNPLSASANGQLGSPVSRQAGTFERISYIQYDGIFEGQTSTGNYRVPYRITAPAELRQGNRSVLVEPPHFAIGLGALNYFVGRDCLFTRGFAHAGVGWSTTSFGDGLDLRILDPTVPRVFVNGGIPDANGRTDDEIIMDFARALEVDPVARRMLGIVERRYLDGFSDSSGPVFRLVSSGRAAGVFDFILAFAAIPEIQDAQDPQEALETGRFDGKVIIVNPEEGVEESRGLIDRGGAPSQYRFYQVAGTPHVPDPLVPFFSNTTTPASYLPALRAHFVQGDRWVKHGIRPPPSTHLRTSDGETLDRDANGNAISVDKRGRPVPRLPFVELGEAHYLVGDFVGGFENVKTIGELGFVSHKAYLAAFARKLADCLLAGYILANDAEEMLRRAALCPPLTYTETYRDHYNKFTTITPCRQ